MNIFYSLITITIHFQKLYLCMLQKINQPNKQKKNINNNNNNNNNNPTIKKLNRFSNNDTYLFFKSVQLMRFIDLNIVY